MSKSIRNPPKLTECKNYEQFVQLIKIWQIATDLPKEKQGAALLLSLEGEAQRAALRVKENELQSDDGIVKVIDELDKLFYQDKTTQKFKALEDLENLKKTKSLTMQQYLLEFETKLDKTTSLGIVWPDDIIAFRLLKNANLPEQDHRLAKATVGGLEYEKVKEKLSFIFGKTETTCASSVKFEELNITDSIDIQDDNNEDESNDVYYGNQYQTTRTSGYNNRNPQYNQNNNPNYNNQNDYQNYNNQNFPSNNGNSRQQNSFPPPQQNVNVPNRQQPMFTRGNNRSRPFQQNRG